MKLLFGFTVFLAGCSSILGIGDVPTMAEVMAYEDANALGQPESGPDGGVTEAGAAEGASEATTIETGVEAGPLPEASPPGDACANATHSTGLGQTWTDCSPPGTYTVVEAAAACLAYARATVPIGPLRPDGGIPQDCWPTWQCDGQVLYCYIGTGSACLGPCWIYDGTQTGEGVSVCSCPYTPNMTWQ